MQYAWYNLWYIIYSIYPITFYHITYARCVLYIRVLQTPRHSLNFVSLYPIVTNDVNSKTANFGDDWTPLRLIAGQVFKSFARRRKEGSRSNIN